MYQRHDRAYKSVAELKQFLKQHTEFEIYDEYNKALSFEELNEELFCWKGGAEKKYLKYVPDGVLDDIWGNTTYLVAGTPNDYDIISPFDHSEYFDLAQSWEPWLTDNPYSKDKDGNDFMEGDFS